LAFATFDCTFHGVEDVIRVIDLIDDSWSSGAVVAVVALVAVVADVSFIRVRTVQAPPPNISATPAPTRPGGGNCEEWSMKCPGGHAIDQPALLFEYVLASSKSFNVRRSCSSWRRIMLVTTGSVSPRKLPVEWITYSSVTLVPPPSTGSSR
jgi:hypothetical protein